MNKLVESLEEMDIINHIETISTNYQLQNVRDDVEDIISLTEYIQDFITNLEIPQSLNDFHTFKDNIFEEISLLFSEELKGEDKSFLQAFYGCNRNQFQGNIEKIHKLQEMIIRKQALYYHFVSEAINVGYFGNLLTKEDTESLSCILDSGIFQYFNRIYNIYERAIELDENKAYKHPDSEGKKHACLQDGKIIPYKDAHSIDNIKPEFFEKIPNENIRAYFSEMYKLLQSGDTSYESWLKIEIYGLKSWNDASSQLSFNTSIEDYDIPGVLIEPEFEFFISTPEVENKQIAIDLSNSFFEEDYGIENTKPFIVESLIASGTVASKSILGKNFPNDADLKDEYGTFTYSMKSKLGSTLVENNRADFSQFIEGDIDIDAFRDFAVNHVSFHEYGHNIFGNKHDSILEETKPDMFDFLHIYKQNLDKPFSDEQIKNFLDYLMITLIRRFKHDGDVSREKYIICQRVVMRALQDIDGNNPLIYWDENDRIGYNIDSEAFASFLEKMNQTLFMIKQIYESAQLDDTQDNFLEQLFVDTDADVKKIYDRVHKKAA